jgi:tRNA-specific 2-thiouridylase
VATKPDSQELCFAPSGDAGAYARTDQPHLVRDGEVVDPTGAVIGRHQGAFRFTIGQRRGTGVATGERRYVVDVDARANRVVVGPGELLDRRGLVADRFSWIAGGPPGVGPFEAEVRIRYRGEDAPCAVDPLDDDRVRIEFRSPQRAVAPGQSAVLFVGDEVLGGGRIVEAIR